MAEKTFVNINGIDKKFVHERTNKDGNTFYSVGILVPNEVSRNGIANVIVNNVHECKSDANKVNIGFPEDWKLKVSVASYYNKNEPDKTKYAEKEMSPKELLSAHLDKLKSMKEKESPAVEEEEEAEIEL